MAVACDAIEVAGNSVQRQALLGEALLGLREGLVDRYGVSVAGYLPLDHEYPTEQGMVATPTTMGAMLALWAHAIADAEVRRLDRILPCDFEPSGPEFSAFRLRLYPNTAEFV